MTTLFRVRKDGVLTTLTMGDAFTFTGSTVNVTAPGGSTAWGNVTGTLADQIDLNSALSGKSATGHDHAGVYATSGHDHTGVYATAAHNHDSAYSAAAHNHTITALNGFPGGTATFLRADGSFAAPSGGSDPWTYVRLASDFPTSSATAVDVGLAFTPTANNRYEIYGMFLMRTATTTVGPRPGLAWPTGMTDGAARIYMPSSATATLIANGNISGAMLTAVGGVPTTTGSWLATIEAIGLAGATPSGTIKVQLASETAGTIVTMKAGSFIKYRLIP